ncbi:MAG: hypothetical protein MK105_15555 [Crocinitomicaceae bacterium]|nr:hypothetical protein [Crocinitomicaceae bacterium]
MNFIQVRILSLASLLFVLGCGNDKSVTNIGENHVEELQSADSIISVDDNESEISMNVDSSRVNTLLNSLYDWVLLGDDEIKLFPFVRQDDIYTGVDFDEIDLITNDMKSKGFFTEAFIDHYRSIYTEIDNRITVGAEKYYVGDIPEFFTHGSPWCNCQDYPEDNKKFTEMVDYRLDIEEDTIYYYWHWTLLESSEYLIKILSEEGEYRIDYMVGFTKENCF